MVNIRLPEMQARWLRNLAEAEHGGNLSAATRKALADAWMMRRAREEYNDLRRHEGFSFPSNEDGTTRGIEFFLVPGREV